ncbi:hypothetical protein [Lactiplantibacillus modestisalitolerans]|uniref:Lipoprotein n=1 Tax=Lactiplantibacillus modestisalitolerans TaxID=1457219 RepID=A0ABV5WYW8_9LACO|nr:hypothetical protein [Lactiplantibacillus modestisalitolerans]
MERAYRSPWYLVLIALIGVVMLSGCTKTTGGATTTSATPIGRSSAVLTKADQQIERGKVAAARKTLAQASNPSTAVTNLATGLRYYQQAADALDQNQLSTAKGYFATLSSYQETDDAAFINARQKLERQYQAVKAANGYYNAARDELSMHNLTTAKNNIDKLDRLASVHPVIKQLQKQALAMKQAIMNYEASQSTSSTEPSSTVSASSSTSSAVADSTSSSVTSSTASETQSSKTSSTATSSADATSSSSTTSGDQTLTTADIVKQFQDAAGGNFANDTEFELTKQTPEYYQIVVIPADQTGQSASQTTDTYRYYPDSGRVTKQNEAGDFEAY